MTGDPVREALAAVLTDGIAARLAKAARCSPLARAACVMRATKSGAA